MKTFFEWSAMALCIMSLLCMYRAVKGPTVFDRIVGGGFIGTKTVIVLLLIGFIYARPDMFIDLALVYSILNFVGTIIFSRFFSRKGAR